jgi:outer membrane protein OmpA-like peptidoglycan-associated protein
MQETILKCMLRYLSWFISCSSLLVCEGQKQRSTDTVIIVYFNSGQFKFDLHEEKKLLTALNCKEFVIEGISGYTDTVGSARKNLILSQKRSSFVDAFLREHFTIANIYPVTYYGEIKPVSLIDNSLNRRVAISFHVPGNMIALSDSGRFTVLKRFELEQIYFRPDEAILEPSSMPYIDYIASLLDAYNNEIFEIRGHVNWNTSSISNNDSGYRIKMNQLSADRAKAVYDILVDKGISPKRMFWRGVGNTQMIYPNAKTDEEKRRNMRVEILILKM